jgi:hypothetical protein
MERIRIATFVSDEAVYADMRASFEAAGFVPPLVAYEVLHDLDDDPFRAITRLGRLDVELVVLVHQDVRCDQGHGIDDLFASVATLDPDWAVAGNAGVTSDGSSIRNLVDPWGDSRAAPLPRAVVVLDENLLVLRPRRRPRCSESLRGFHLYGADVCLNAARDGSSCWVVDFRVTHLSGGSLDGFADAVDRFSAVWSRSVWRPRYLPTMQWPVALARPRLLRRVLNHQGVRRRLTAP